MRVETADTPLEDFEADLVCLGIFDGEALPDALAEAPGAADVDTGAKKLSMLRPGATRRVLVVGLGEPDDFDDERARVAAALAVRQAGRYDAGSIAWRVPGGPERAAGVVEGTILAAYRFERFKTGAATDDEPPPPGPSTLTLLGSGFDERAIEVARASAEAANRARELQNLPANVADPAFLAERAREIAAAHESVEVEVLGRDQLEAEGMGGILAVSAGSATDPSLIVLRYSGGGEGAPTALVGKGVTFDTGGISLKPPASMPEMKFDMSGAAAVIEATAAIAELELPVELLAIVPAVENMPDARATRPGDIITQLNGKTVEVNNTDAEGRLILADALTYAARRGCERIVDIATLTGAVVSALGSTYAAVLANDDDWADTVTKAGAETGELLWRLPLHPEYKAMIRGKYADLSNSGTKRKAGTIYAAEFLEEFVEDTTWAHIDMAGTGSGVDREYVGSGATGFGTRLFVRLALSLSEASG